MGIGASFWASLGVDALWHNLDTFTDGFNIGAGGDGTRGMIVGPCQIYQEASSVGGNQNRVQDNPGYDSGYFYAYDATADVTVRCHAVFIIGETYPNGASECQAVLLQPNCKRGDLIPKTVNTNTDFAYDKNPMYKGGFGQAYDAGRPADQYSGQDSAWLIHVEDLVGTWRLHHYNPFAWWGSVPEVIAAAAMAAGVSSDFIDQASFDNSHDAYHLTTGDAPWADLDSDWEIYANRIVGEKVSDFLTKIAGHGRDFLFVNESGKLALDSFTRPLYSATGLSLKEDQILALVSWTQTIKHTFNSVRSSWGQANRLSWEDTDGYTGARPGSTEMAVSFEPHLESRPIDKWVDDDEDTTSLGLFGRLWLNGQKVISNFRGQPQETEISHYPFIMSPHVTRSDFWLWDKATEGGGMVHVTNWLPSDGKIRTQLEIRQGPIGFDIGLGDEITDLEITGDGRTILNSRVIERTYNFDTLTMDSTILEIPPN
jgi:hypothetical protein